MCSCPQTKEINRVKKICVFAGSMVSSKKQSYIKSALNLGLEISRKNYALVYGGAKTGLMGQLADSVLSAGGKVFGVIPKNLMSQELAHDGLSKLYVVQ